MTKLLLDSHVLLWVAEENRRLGRKATALILSPDSEVWVSAATVWELANKSALGRLTLRRPFEDWLPGGMQANDFQPLPVNHEHALAAAILPRYHNDPFDRMLIAQAQIEDLRVLTADSQFESYDVRLIDATE